MRSWVRPDARASKFAAVLALLAVATLGIPLLAGCSSGSIKDSTTPFGPERIAALVVNGLVAVLGASSSGDRLIRPRGSVTDIAVSAHDGIFTLGRDRSGLDGATVTRFDQAGHPARIWRLFRR